MKTLKLVGVEQISSCGKASFLAHFFSTWEWPSLGELMWMMCTEDMHTQGLVLKALWRLTQHYVTAVASSTTSRTQVAAQILTMR